MALSISELKIGVIIKYNGQPYQVIKNKHVKTGRGRAVMQTKLKHLVSGSVTENTFSTPDFEWADTERVKAQYLYNDGNDSYFMFIEDYEQITLPVDAMEEQLKYLIEGTDVFLLKFEGKVVSCEIPTKVVLEVTETPPGVKGDTVSGGTKPATLETGVIVNVPLFVNGGDKVRVNTETNTYLERV